MPRFALALLLLPAFSAATLAAQEVPDITEHDLTEVWSNPALLPRFDGDVPVLGASLVHVYINDSDDLLDGLDDVGDESKRLEQQSRFGVLLPSDVEPLIRALRALDNRVVNGDAKAGIASAFSVNEVPFAVHFRMSGRFAARFVFDPQDEQTLRNATLIGAFTQTDLQSKILSAGVVIGDLGVTHARDLADDGSRRLGVTVKHQEIILFERNVPISEYSEDELYDRHRDIERHRTGNIDIGYFHSWGRWSASLSVSNLIRQKFEGPDRDDYDLRPQVRLGANYHLSWARFALNHDVTPEPGFGEMKGRRVTLVKSVFPIGNNLDLKLGYQFVDKDYDDDAVQVGLRYHLLEHFHMEAQYSFAGAQESGASFQMQLVF